MNSNSRRNSENSSAIHSCFGWPRHRAVHTFILAFSTSIFILCMILSVYFTYKSSLDKIVVVLLVGSGFIYLLGFYGNMYSIFYCKPIDMPSGNGGGSNPINHTSGDLARSSFTCGPPPDILCASRLREVPRKTPPPPYEVQMSEMSRMMLPGTSQTNESSTRESEIAGEARKLIQRIYEEIRRTEQQIPISPTRVQSRQQSMQMHKSSMRQQETVLPNVPRQNLVIQRQQTDLESIPAPGMKPVGLRANQVFQKKATLHSSQNQLDLKRLVIGNEGHIADSSQQSPQRGFLQVSHKRKSTNSPKVLRTKSSIKKPISHAGNISGSDNKLYEEIEVSENTQNMNTSANNSVGCFHLQSELENPSERAKSVDSALSEFNRQERRRKSRNTSMKGRHQLSEISTKKFRQLGQSPESVLDAIATCFDLTPDQWMVAWKLSLKGVSPRERAKIIGVRLHGDSYKNDN